MKSLRSWTAAGLFRDGRAGLRRERRPPGRRLRQLHGHGVVLVLARMGLRRRELHSLRASGPRRQGLPSSGNAPKQNGPNGTGGNGSPRRAERQRQRQRPRRRQRRTATATATGSRSTTPKGRPDAVGRPPTAGSAGRQRPGSPKRAGGPRWKGSDPASSLARSTTATRRRTSRRDDEAGRDGCSSNRSRGGDPPAATTSCAHLARAHVEGAHDVQVVRERQRGREHAHHHEPPPARLVDRGEDEQLPEEASRQGEPGHREHEPPHRDAEERPLPAEPLQRRRASPGGPAALPGGDDRERPDARRAVGDQVVEERHGPPPSSRRRSRSAGSRRGTRRVREQAFRLVCVSAARFPIASEHTARTETATDQMLRLLREGRTRSRSIRTSPAGLVAAAMNAVTVVGRPGRRRASTCGMAPRRP